MPSAVPSDDNHAGQLSGILDAFVDFDQEMRALGRMEYEDQKSRAVEQLRLSGATCRKLQAEFDEIVVDEYQDISRLDAMLMYYSADLHPGSAGCAMTRRCKLQCLALPPSGNGVPGSRVRGDPPQRDYRSPRRFSVSGEVDIPQC